jgi:hypothetical protein
VLRRVQAPGTLAREKRRSQCRFLHAAHGGCVPVVLSRCLFMYEARVRPDSRDPTPITCSASRVSIGSLFLWQLTSIRFHVFVRQLR